MTRILRSVARKSPTELWWRSQERLRAGVERIAVATRGSTLRRERLRSQLVPAAGSIIEARTALSVNDWRTAADALRHHFSTRERRFPIDPARRQSITESILEQFPEAAGAARSLGDRLLAGRRRLLGYDELSIGTGDRIDWHFDPVHQRRAPLQFWADVPYLNPEFGDHKIIWELNRHQHWLALGRAAWLTGDSRYADVFQQELATWLAQNPPLVGVNWSSMLELGFRSISWIWSLHFFVPLESESTDSTWLLDLLVGLDAQLNHIARHLSRYFSPNTHLLGEGLALYTAGRVLPEFASAPRWEAAGRQILREEAHRQVNRDGGHAEMSTHYHRYALDFYLLALSVARLTGDPDAGLFTEVSARMATFCRALASDAGILPTIGDDDGGLLFPICDRRPAEAADSLSLAAALLRRPELAAGDPPEETLWMLGGDRTQLRWPNSSQPGSALFSETGYAVLRSGDSYAIVDIGRHGFLNGGHAHADALSLVMLIDGRPFIVDPGTSTYTMDARRRDLFRSTAMHNTLTVDGREQSTPDSPFHWRSAANSRVRLWRTDRAFDVVEGEHDGYRPHVHRRAVLRDASGLWIIADHFLGRGEHRLDLRWHLDSAWQVAQSETHTATLRHADGHAACIASAASRITHGAGGTLGWRAPVYGQLLAAPTIEVTETGDGPLSVVTAIAAGAAAKGLSIDRVVVMTDHADGWHRAGVSGHYGGGRFIGIFATENADGAHPEAQAVQQLRVDGKEFHTDARIAVLCLSAFLEPLSLTLIDGHQASWSGTHPFCIGPLSSAADLHLDRAALTRLSHSQPVTAGSVEQTICAE